MIATIRALSSLHDLDLQPDELAKIAWAAEAEDLGIAAGPQDRFAQSYEGLTLMDFSGKATVTRLDPRSLPPLFVAYRADAAESSGVPHARLRRRAASNADVRDAMSQLARLAREAAAAVARDDATCLGACIDGSFEARRRIMELDPRHERMVEIAREHGAAANYAGSGGAIVGIRPDGSDALRSALEAEGCVVLEPRL